MFVGGVTFLLLTFKQQSCNTNLWQVFNDFLAFCLISWMSLWITLGVLHSARPQPNSLMNFLLPLPSFWKFSKWYSLYQLWQLFRLSQVSGCFEGTYIPIPANECSNWTMKMTELVCIIHTHRRRFVGNSFNEGPNNLEERQVPPLREPYGDCPVHYKNPSSPSENDHVIAQETVIELIQQEVDEDVSSLHRDGGEEKNNRSSPASKVNIRCHI